MVVIEVGGDGPGIKATHESVTINTKQLTPEKLFSILEDHPRLHYLKALYEQLFEIQGKAQTDKEITEITNPDWKIDRNYVEFIVRAHNAKKPITRRIKNIYRFRGPDGKEYIKWSGTLLSENKLGEPISTSSAGVGYGEKPIYKQKFDHKELEWRPTLEVAQTKPVCTIEWNKKNIDELSKDFYNDDNLQRTEFYFIDYKNTKQACPREMAVEEWIEWWKTLPRKEMLDKLTALAAKRTANPNAVML